MKINELEKRILIIEKEMLVLRQIRHETSYTRILLIIFTYLSIGLYLQAINVFDPWRNGVVPSIGFLLSSLTLSFFKHLWIKMR